jgi:hypothetical protein
VGRAAHLLPSLMRGSIVVVEASVHSASTHLCSRPSRNRADFRSSLSGGALLASLNRPRLPPDTPKGAQKPYCKGR